MEKILDRMNEIVRPPRQAMDSIGELQSEIDCLEVQVAFLAGARTVLSGPMKEKTELDSIIEEKRGKIKERIGELNSFAGYDGEGDEHTDGVECQLNLERL